MLLQTLSLIGIERECHVQMRLKSIDLEGKQLLNNHLFEALLNVS